MGRLSLARTLRAVLLALVVVLTAIVAVAVADVLRARQRYEDALVSAASLSSAASDLYAAGIVEEETLRTPGAGPPAGAGNVRTRAEAAAGFAAAAATARGLARADPASAVLVARQVAAEETARRLAAAGRGARASAPGGPLDVGRRAAAALRARQTVRVDTARVRERSDSRHALLLTIAAAALALLGSLGLVTALVARVRGPLAALVTASGDLAAGRLDRRVAPAGPRELQELGRAFNAMADALVTARARIEAGGRRLATTVASLGDALLVTEPDGETVAVANPRTRELVPELTPGRPATGSGSPLPPLDAVLTGEVTIEHGGRTLAVTAARLGGEDRDGAVDPDGVVWTIRDMTERARLERAKSEFVATASHELRSPLTSIKGFIELLQRSSGNLDARQREFIDIVLRSTDRLAELIEDLLDVARIEAGHMEIDLRPTDVGEALRDTAELMAPRIAEKHQRLDIELAPALSPALADPGRLRQIVANLLTNAHLYTGEGGRITARAAPDRAWVEIEITDTGRGMAADEQARAFERFYRGAAGTGRSAETPGSGLGLSIVASLVELHHGEISLESTPGRGTTFRVRLPAAVRIGDGARTLAAVGGRKVLVVDDEPEIAGLIAGQLAALDVTTVIATGGADALERLATEQFDAMTLDVLMPGTDGLEVLRRVRADPRTHALPVVFVSVFSPRRELAGEWVVAKPIDADELREVLASAVSTGRSRLLVVAREDVRERLEPSLAALGVEVAHASGGTAAARLCAERRFELALVDTGLRNPRAVLQALDLRGRRIRSAVILVAGGDVPLPDGIRDLGLEVVPVEEAARAVAAAVGETPAG